jgi:4-hydroxy-3-methylbut-2-enyl diphosphate reductase IspH
VQTDADVRPEWFDEAKVVGLTAGTSTPDDVIDRVEARIQVEAWKRQNFASLSRLDPDKGSDGLTLV